MPDRIFITGSTGFVGANLTRLLLDRGHPIRALARPSSDLQGLDLLCQTTLANSLPRLPGSQ